MGGGNVSEAARVGFSHKHAMPLEHIIRKYVPEMTPYEAMYKKLHQFPGLSLQEHLAAETAASHLRALGGFEVKTGIGGTGLIGVLRNGPGRTVLLRADTDALPVKELTGLPYASQVCQVDVEDGILKPVHHACGHDTHVTSLLAAAETLHDARPHWAGTVIFLFQPNEERGGGARAMVLDGLYDPHKHACPLPDVVLGQHVMPAIAGSLGSRRGAFGSSSDSFEVTVYGRGGHASAPHRAVDPILLAAAVIMRLQGIVSREIDPTDFAVVTVASIHAGLTENVIADEATMKINIRAAKPETRDHLISAIRRIVQAECDATGATKEYKWTPTHSLPPLINDEATTMQLEGPFRDYFGASYDSNLPYLGGSEDFSVLATQCPNKAGGIGVPYTFWTFGGTDPVKWREAEKNGRLAEDIPNNHSAYFAPAIQPTLSVAVKAMAIAALVFLRT